MRIYLTGFSGQIGSVFRNIFRENNKKIILLGRNKPNLYQNETYMKFDLNSFSFEKKIQYDGNCIIIHCAHDFYIQNGLSQSPNLIGTKHLINYFSECFSSRFIYFSTPFDYHLSDNASFYQKEKAEIEKLFDLKKDLILSPSLLVSENSKVSKIFQFMQRICFPVPIPSETNNIAPIDTCDFVLTVSKRFIDKKTVGKFIVTGSNELSFRSFLQHYYKIKSIGIPILFFRFLIRILKFLKFNFFAERLMGLLNLPNLKKLKEKYSFIEIEQHLKI